MARGFPSMTALLGLLAVAGYQNRDKIAEMLNGLGQGGSPGAGGTAGGAGSMGRPDHGDTGAPAGGSAGLGRTGGLGGLLGGLAGGAGAGGLLSGGLGELVERFRETGHGDTADSWVGTGPNREIAPTELERAIGPDVLDTLTERTGLPRDELLARLTRELPKAVDSYTPDGRLPSA
jgi:uncharacterized protein YidB (DUF937 family)